MRRMGQPNPDLKSEILNLEINNHLEKIGNYALNVVQALYHMASMEENPERIAAEVDKMAESNESPSEES